MALNNLTRIGNSGFGTDTSINTTGIVTAASFSGDGSGLTGITALGSGVVVQEEGSNVGTAQTINFIGSGVTATFSGGIASVEISTSGGGGGGLSDVVSDTTPQLGGNLDLNSNNITGTGDINITGDATFSGDLDVDGHVDLDNVSIAGVSTANQLNVTGVSTFVGKTEFTTNNVVLTSTNQLRFGGGENTFLYKGTDNNSYLQTNNNEFRIGAPTLRLQSYSSVGYPGEDFIVATKDGSVDLYYDNSKKFETTNTGAIVTGTLVATATTATNVTVANEASDTECFVMFGVNATGNNAPKSSSSLKYNSSTGGLTAGSFIGDGSGLTGITASGSGVIVRDGGSLVGTAGTIDFGSNVSVSPISAGVVTVTASAGSIPGISTAQTTQLNNLTVAGVSTFTGAIDANSDLDVAGHISLRDNDEIRLGTDDDFYIRNRPYSGGFNYAEIVHTGTHIRIASNKIILDATTGANMIHATQGGPVDVYYSGSKKFETSGVGVTITSQLDTTNIVASGVITATTFSGSGASLTTLDASELDSGTIPDARFPATLPAVSGANLTNLPAPTPADTDVQVTFDVSSNGSSAYRITGPGYSGADDNPDIYLVRGQRYRFINGTGSSHPFRIQSDTSGTAYTDGVSGSQNGTQDFNVQHDAPVRLYYQCTIHSGMIGNIYIVGGSDWRMTDVATNATPEIFTNLNVGIGTDNPVTNFKLDVNGDLSLGELGGTDNTYIDQKQNGQLDIINSGRSANNGRVRINKTNSISGDTTYFRDFEVYDGKDNLVLLVDGSSSRIGIGTDNPQEKLHIHEGDVVIGQDSGNSTDIRNYIKFGRVDAPKAAIGFINDAGNGRGDIIFMNNNDSDAASFSNSDEKLRVRSDGDVLIGTNDLESNLDSRRRLAICDTTNGALLHIRGQSPAIYFDQSAGNTPKMYLDNAGLEIWSHTPASAGTNFFKIDSDGYRSFSTQPYVLLRKDGTNQNITADAIVEFNSTVTSEGGMTVNASRSRITVPKAGKYAVLGAAAGSNTTVGVGDGWRLDLYRDGAVYGNTYTYPINTVGASTGEEYTLQTSLIVPADANDYFEFKISSVGSARANVRYGYFCVYYLG